MAVNASIRLEGIEAKIVQLYKVPELQIIKVIQTILYSMEKNCLTLLLYTVSEKGKKSDGHAKLKIYVVLLPVWPILLAWLPPRAFRVLLHVQPLLALQVPLVVRVPPSSPPLLSSDRIPPLPASSSPPSSPVLPQSPYHQYLLLSHCFTIEL